MELDLQITSLAEESGEKGPQATAVAVTRRRRGGKREPAP
jgi:hypothetical protein